MLSVVFLVVHVFLMIHQKNDNSCKSKNDTAAVWMLIIDFLIGIRLIMHLRSDSN